MKIERREFLKLAGLSAIFGLGGTAIAASVQQTPSYIPDPKELTGKRWALVINMDKFKSEADVKKVIEVCHTKHNVPTIPNPKQEVKWIFTEMMENVFPEQQDKYLTEHYKHMPFLTLCNHCANPPCVRVCPTQATFKRKSDGIVMMDMHRCIGCRFCMAGCPYGARSLNWIDPRPYLDPKKINPEFPTRMKGVVEKCTLCYELIAVGKIPACAEASNGAIVFGDLEDPKSAVRKVLAETYTIRRKPELGTRPSVYYVIGGMKDAGKGA
ncbi:MAG TPA: 4Fe-4S dicluster domain-containing protein [Dissulfurispiraceae bacterium]|nr:4Fe-4S dicluster domain-containing protein [Dissulfurispiraceae bacterium]